MVFELSVAEVHIIVEALSMSIDYDFYDTRETALMNYFKDRIDAEARRGNA